MQFSKNNSYRNFFVEKYGIPKDIMESYDFYHRGKGIWAFSGEFVEENAETIGIRALRIGKSLKPTTAFLRIVGKHATKNVAILDEISFLKFLRGEDVEYHNVRLERGYIIVRNSRDILGCGYYTGEKIISAIPKKYRLQDTWI